MLKLILLFTIFLSGHALGQQNFFNIPSGQLTPESKLFYQHQINAYSTEKISSKQHIVYGLGDKMEVGLNFLNFDPSGTSKTPQLYRSAPHSNILAATFQKAFQLNTRLFANFGSQFGLSHIGTGRPSYPAGKTYSLLSFHDGENHLRLAGGAWVSGSRFNGAGSPHGALLGFEWMFTKGVYLMGDWISGDTQNSVSVIGGMVDVSRTVQICLGYLIPNPNSTEDHSLVMELNVFNF
jgi:hypothetical protein